MLCFDVPLLLPMSVVAVGADHLAFPDRMVGRQMRFGEDLGMTLVAGLRLLNRHGQPFWPGNIRVHQADSGVGWETLDRRTRVRVVAVRAGHSMQVMRRRMPGHGR